MTAFTFTVTRAGKLDDAASVDWAVTGTGANPANAADFIGGAFPSGTASFLATETSKLITVDVNPDATFEQDEGFTVTLSNPSATGTILTSTASGTITNDDAYVSTGAGGGGASGGRGGDFSGAGPAYWGFREQYLRNLTRAQCTAYVAKLPDIIEGEAPPDAQEFIVERAAAIEAARVAVTKAELHALGRTVRELTTRINKRIEVHRKKIEVSIDDEAVLMTVIAHLHPYF